MKDIPNVYLLGPQKKIEGECPSRLVTFIPTSLTSFFRRRLTIFQVFPASSMSEIRNGWLKEASFTGNVRKFAFYIMFKVTVTEVQTKSKLGVQNAEYIQNKKRQGNGCKVERELEKEDRTLRRDERVGETSINNQVILTSPSATCKRISTSFFFESVSVSAPETPESDADLKHASPLGLTFGFSNNKNHATM